MPIIPINENAVSPYEPVLVTTSNIGKGGIVSRCYGCMFYDPQRTVVMSIPSVCLVHPTIVKSGFRKCEDKIYELGHKVSGLTMSLKEVEMEYILHKFEHGIFYDS